MLKESGDDPKLPNGLFQVRSTCNGMVDMSLEKVRAAEDRNILSNPEIAMMIGAKCRKTPLDFDQVKTLVLALLPGKARQANLERYDGGWRLRFSIFDADGVKRRKSVILGDADTALWVKDFLAGARKERTAYICGLWRQAFKETLA